MVGWLFTPHLTGLAKLNARRIINRPVRCCYEFHPPRPLISGLLSIAFIVLLTLVSVIFILTGQIAALESSRSTNLAFASFALFAEVLALLGVTSGVLAQIKREEVRAVGLIGLALNLLGACVFLPASASLLFNLFIGIVDRVGK